MKPDVIALTGKIGSGKSTVASILRQWGHKTVDCDLLARQAEDARLVEEVKRLLGSEYVSDGKLNRALIRQKVFADGNLLNQYQALFFDGVRKRIIQAAASARDVLFVEIPVADAFPFDWTEVWRVECDRDAVIGRVSRRDGVSAQSVEQIFSLQKVYPCTRIIFNNGSLSELEQNVRLALDAYRQGRFS